MEFLRKDFNEILSSEVISILGGLVAGTLLAFSTDQIELIPGLLILLPGFLEMRGNISGSLASRLSSGLFLRVVKPRVQNTKILRGNIIASVFLVIIVSAALGTIAFIANFYMLHVYTIQIIYIAIIAAVLSNVIEIPLTIFTTFWLFRHGHDPNNIMGPYVTTTGDIVSVLSLLAAILMVA